MIESSADTVETPEPREAGSERSGTRSSADNPDLWRVSVALAALALLAVIGVAGLSGHQALAQLAMLLFAVVGIGTVPLQLIRPLTPGGETLAIVSGFATLALGGYLFVELPLWSLSPATLWIVVLVAASVHVRALVALRGRGMERGDRPTDGRRWRARTLRPGLGSVLTVIGALTALVTALMQQHLPPGPGGLLTSIAPSWHLGVALMVVGVIMALASGRGSLAFPTLALITVVAVTPPIVYDLARYSWTQKHIGVVQLFLHYGETHPPVDLYQAWPGFFDAMAWLTNSLGSRDVDGLAQWWPVVCSLLCAILVRRIAINIGVDTRLAWFGALLSFVANTIGQDYFSPQAFSLVLALGLVAIATRPVANGVSLSGYEMIVFVAGALAMAISHQLTPYVVFGFLVILAAFNESRSRLLLAPIVLLSALAVAVPHLDLIKNYFNIGQIGQVSQNLETVGVSSDITYDLAGHLATVGLVVGPSVVGLLGLAAFLRRRDRVGWSLVLCALSPALIVVAVRYGQEGLLRAALFSTPWWAILAARGLSDHQRDADLRAESPKGRFQTFCVATVPVGLLALLLATTCNDYINVVRPTDITAERHYERLAPSGSLLLVVSDVHYQPIKSTYRYLDLDWQASPLGNIPGNARPVNRGVANARFLTRAVVGATRYQARRGKTLPPVYVLGTRQAVAVGDAHNLWTEREYAAMFARLSANKRWRVVYRADGSTLLRFIVPARLRR